MSARETILAAVRGANRQSPSDHAAVKARLSAKKQNIRPARSADDDTAVMRFISEAKLTGSDVVEASGKDEIPAIIAAYLRKHNMAGDIRVSGDPLFSDVNWQAEPMLALSSGAAEPGGTASLNVADVGIAETGTLALASSQRSPVMLNFLPMVHIAVILEQNIIGGYETAWKFLREKFSNDNDTMPRSVSMVTGPSRTADIEQELLMGAHGPQNHMIIVLKQE